MTYPIPVAPIASLHDNDDGVAICRLGFCVMFGHDCDCDPIRLACTSGSIRFDLEIVRRLVQTTLLMLF